MKRYECMQTLAPKIREELIVLSLAPQSVAEPNSHHCFLEQTLYYF